MSDSLEGGTPQCEHGDCVRDAHQKLTTEVNGIARETHLLCDEHAEVVRNSPIKKAKVVEEEDLAGGKHE